MDLLTLLTGVLSIAILCRCRKRAVRAAIVGLWVLGISLCVVGMGSQQRRLDRAATRTTKIVIEVRGFADGAMQAVKTIEVSSPDEIETFFETLRLKRRKPGFAVRSCACRGNPHVHLQDADGPFVKITIHHAESVRSNLWSGNIDIRAEMIPRFKQYFETHGVTLEEQEARPFLADGCSMRI